MCTLIEVRGLGKTFTLHNQGGARLPVLDAIDFDAGAGDCLALSGPSGAGKSTLLRCLYGNYLATRGSIRVRYPGAGADGRDACHAADALDKSITAAAAADNANANTANAPNAPDPANPWIELVGASEQRILQVRRDVIGYVSQFLRAIPRVGALDVVAEPLVQRGVDRLEARERAAVLLRRLNLPQRLWTLPPATFSGGEQQRVNIARGWIGAHPILLLDEPTASLDAANRDIVIDLIRDACAAGRCLIGIFHDETVRAAVATRRLDLSPPADLLAADDLAQRGHPGAAVREAAAWPA